MTGFYGLGLAGAVMRASILASGFWSLRAAGHIRNLIKKPLALALRDTLK